MSVSFNYDVHCIDTVPTHILIAVKESLYSKTFLLANSSDIAYTVTLSLLAWKQVHALLTSLYARFKPIGRDHSPVKRLFVSMQSMCTWVKYATLTRGTGSMLSKNMVNFDTLQGLY